MFRMRCLSAMFALLAAAEPVLAQQPQIAELLPSSVTVGGPDFELVIRGAGFIPGTSRVQFNGAALQGLTTSPTEIRVRVPSQFFSRDPFVSEGDFRDGVYATSLIVLNGPESDAPMARKRFEIRKAGVSETPVFNAPIITAISPNPVPVGGTVIVAGDNFRPAAGGPDEFFAALVTPAGARFNAVVQSRTRTQLQLGLAGVPQGSYALEVHALNTGREASVRSQATVVVGSPTVLGPPTIASVGPTPVTTRGATMYVTGTNFDEQAEVTLVPPAGAGDVLTLARAPNQARTPERLYVRLPALAYPGTYTLRVRNPEGPVAEHALVVQHIEQAQVDRAVAEARARPERPRPDRPRPAAPAASTPAPRGPVRGQVGYQYSDVVEYCFGAVGPKCDGAPNAGVRKNADGTVTMMVSVGSILHDNCCLQYPPAEGNPGGKFCNGPLTEYNNNGKCHDEWDKAFWNTLADGRQWEWTFDPNQRAELIVTDARPSRFQDRALRSTRHYTGRETTDTRRLKAPAGTALDVGDEAFCESGRAEKKSFAAKEWIECLP